MTPCHVVEITTPKKFILNGLWFGSQKPKRVFVWVHGLGSSMFSKSQLATSLVDKNTAVLMFNNRGHDPISRARKQSGKSILAGGGAEVFTDCVDDIEGALNLVRKQRPREIFLVGHSTGCQKSVYWASKTGGKKVKGIVLLAPISDYSAALKMDKRGQLARATAYARKLMRQGKRHELLPQSVWPLLNTAQRFLSLYSPDSVEELFTYASPNINPRLFKKVQVPILSIFAARDEYGDRPATKIAAWFEKNTQNKMSRSVVVPNAKHSFKGREKDVVHAIRRWRREVS